LDVLDVLEASASAAFSARAMVEFLWPETGLRRAEHIEGMRVTARVAVAAIII
jgi:hypothetical protein